MHFRLPTSIENFQTMRSSPQLRERLQQSYAEEGGNLPNTFRLQTRKGGQYLYAICNVKGCPAVLRYKIN